MATNGDAGNDAAFLNDYIATGFDPFIPRFGDFVVSEADIAATFGALSGLRFMDRPVVVATVEADHLSRWFCTENEPCNQRWVCELFDFPQQFFGSSWGGESRNRLDGIFP